MVTECLTKNDISCYICNIRLTGLLVEYVKYRTLSIYNGVGKLIQICKELFFVKKGSGLVWLKSCSNNVLMACKLDKPQSVPKSFERDLFLVRNGPEIIFVLWTKNGMLGKIIKTGHTFGVSFWKKMKKQAIR